MLKERVGRYLPYLEKNRAIENNDSTIINNLISQVYE